MTTVWWWVVGSQAEQGDSSRPADARLISTPDSGAEYNALVTGGSYNGLYRYQGPFTSQSAAQSATASPSVSGLQELEAGTQAAGDESGNPIAEAAGLAAGGTSDLTNPLQFLGDIANIFGDLTEASTWIRFAKIVVGGTLIIVGVAHLSGAEKAAKDIASKVPIIPV